MSSPADAPIVEAVRLEAGPAEQPEATPTSVSDEQEVPPAETATQTPKPVEEEDEEDEDVNDTCGFCIFMRGGGCRKAFNAWSKCVDKEREDGADFATRCGEQTLALRECMLQHKDYYAPLLEEEEEIVAANAAAEKAQAETGNTDQPGTSEQAESAHQGNESAETKPAE